MEKEFIPYEQALALKELGFDEPCFGYWNIDPQLKNPVFNMVKPFEHDWCLPAPTFSQAFRWFREKYNKESYIRKLHTYYYHINDTESFFGDFNTYEEAESACLDKLIEIVKTNEQ